jgi:hypothetical protein
MPSTQTNVEYWFRLVYECVHGACYGGAVDSSQLSVFLANLWLKIIFIGYALSVAGLIFTVYIIVRIFELRKREHHHFETLLIAPDKEGVINTRWHHIETLRDSSQPNDWRTAIIEADIMLDDLLTKLGYEGLGVGEKLKAAEASDFTTRQDAWEAHKVRNQIAHEGSSFPLTGPFTRRTLARYEAVFEEFKAL